MEPVAVVGLGGDKVVSSWQLRERTGFIREISHCIPFYTFWRSNHISTFLTQNIKKKTH